MDVPEKYSLKELLEKLDYSKSVAVFINGKQILMAEYDVLKLKQNHNIRILRPLGGG